MGDSALISAERFARERASYWNQLLPRLEPFIRLLNLSVGRFSPPMAATVAPERRAFVAELGFELFRTPVEGPIEPESELVDQAADGVRIRIATLAGRPVEDIAPPTPAERSEAVALAGRLRRFVRQRVASTYTVDPVIPGCGIVESATADLLIDRARFSLDVDAAETYDHLLYEVKTVTRPFRAIDVRQLITYAALMAAADEAPVTVGVVNPRLGTFVECPLDRLAEDIAGLPANRLLQQIIFDISASEISR
jgi:hypothetical protein